MFQFTARMRLLTFLLLPSLRALLTMIVVVLGATSSAHSADQETPRLLKSGVMSLSRWCGDHALIIFGQTEGEGLLWFDVRSKKHMNLSTPVGAWKPDEPILAVGILACSPDGRWILGDYSHFNDNPDAECEQYRNEPPPVVLWDAREGKHYDVGKGYWRFFLEPRWFDAVVSSQ